MELSAGAETKRCSASQISFFAVNALLCLWMDVSGMDVVRIAGYRKTIGAIGNARLRETLSETVQSPATFKNPAGSFSEFGNIHSTLRFELLSASNRC